MADAKSPNSRAVFSVLEALFAGYEITFQGYVYMIGDDPEGRPRVCIRLYKLDTSTGKESEFLKEEDLTMNQFFDECAKLTKEELFAIQANLALQKARSGSCLRYG